MIVTLSNIWLLLYDECQVNPQFYAFRWITLLLTQEFNFADSLHIWDALLSDPEGPQVSILLLIIYIEIVCICFQF